MIKWLTKVFNTFIFTPLAGGNGKIQMDEYARVVLLFMIVYSTYLEGRSPDQIFPDIYWIMLFAAVCAVAAIKPAFSKKDITPKISNEIKDEV